MNIGKGLKRSPSFFKKTVGKKEFGTQTEVIKIDSNPEKKNVVINMSFNMSLKEDDFSSVLSAYFPTQESSSDRIHRDFNDKMSYEPSMKSFYDHDTGYNKN